MTVAGILIVMACLMAMGRKRQQQAGQAAEERSTMWDKMRKGMEEMPEDFPPRVMYDNAEAARANTERILEILEGGEGEPTAGTTADDKATAKA